ncbi:hypothetical protein [Streptomyces sp. NPDC002825]|uniref:hypothetical protein n=1 Tax=Streptomyces sp. NPDC002825 TaxID=3154666 RepID=UPI00332DC416
MDAGLAGLIGALGGGVIGAAGASFAALIAFRGARYQADRQSTATHEQWLRQIRRDLYIRFIAAGRTCAEHMRATVNERGEIDRNELRLWSESAKAVTDAFLALELEAPGPLVRLAEMISHVSGPGWRAEYFANSGRVLTPHENRVELGKLNDYQELLNQFIGACRQSLQGTDPSGSFTLEGLSPQS